MKNINLNFVKTFILLFIIATVFLQAQQGGIIKVTVKEGQTIRDISKEYLKDPDLWEEILKSNNLKSPADVKTGMTLVIPYKAIIRAKEAIESASAEIKKATEAGAKTFAASLINKAVDLYNKAITARKAGDWEKSFTLAEESRINAISAFNEAESKSKTKGEATLTFTKGTVEGRKPSESVWKSLNLKSKLYEDDRVRTLSNSYAEVSFQDQSKIRLNENSQAVIQKTRVDLLNNRSESSVSLEKGNAFALLSGGNQTKRKFNFDIPGVKSDIKSKSFWINKDEKKTQIANYDGEITLQSTKKQVTLKQNEGSSVASNGNITDPKKLLPAPKRIFPTAQFISYESNVTFKWDSVKGAKSYILSLYADAAFKTIVGEFKDIRSNISPSVKLDKGIYYWRVSAVDDEGFPGAFSDAGSFTVIIDNQPPYLVISNPRDGFFTKNNKIQLTGRTEASCLLYINGKQYPVNTEDGTFEATLELQTGINEFSIEAVDKSGNKNKIVRKVRHSLTSNVFLEFDKNVFLEEQNKNLILPASSTTLRGTTLTNSTVRFTLSGTSINIKSLSDSVGNFLVTLNNVKDSSLSSWQIISADGDTGNFQFGIVVDKWLPVIQLDSEPITTTNKSEQVFSGKVTNTKVLLFNGNTIPVTDGSFSVNVPLLEGTNEIIFTAENKYRNKSTLRRVIKLDTTPPELISYAVTPKKVKGEGIIKLEVKAKDQSDLKRTVKVIYNVGMKSYTEYLKYNESTGSYFGMVSVNSNGIDEISFQLILLEDQLGNIREYNLF